MAHFARINSDNIVEHVCVVDDINLLNESEQEDEETGITYLNELHGDEFTWIQTSVTGNIRKNYAGIGFTYDGSRDAFISPQAFASWTLNEDTCRWDPPTAYPDR